VKRLPTGNTEGLRRYRESKSNIDENEGTPSETDENTYPGQDPLQNVGLDFAQHLRTEIQEAESPRPGGIPKPVKDEAKAARMRALRRSGIATPVGGNEGTSFKTDENTYPDEDPPQNPSVLGMQHLKTEISAPESPRLEDGKEASA
jgi:hypothetical protein